jgi:hypothetical protein
MGYVYALGRCGACKRLINFNPKTVPSIRIMGEREPICRDCVERWQKLHPDKSFVIAPNAYDELDESEL